MTPKISLKSTAELVCVVPYMVGFRPVESIVLLCLDGTSQLGTARVDIPDEQDHIALAVRAMVGPAVRAGATALLALVYTEDPARVVPVFEAVAREAADHELDVQEWVVVKGEQFACQCPDCDGRFEPIPPAHEVPAAAEYIGLGHSIAPGREQIEAEYAAAGTGSDPLRSIMAIEAQVTRPEAEVGEVARQTFDAWLAFAAYTEALDAGRSSEGRAPANPPRFTQRAQLVGGLRQRDVRDGVVMALCPGSLGTNDFPEAMRAPLAQLVDCWASQPFLDRGRALLVEGLLALAHELPADHAAPLLTVVGAAHWHDGDGMRALLALDRARELEPDLYLATLLTSIVANGVRPPHLQRRSSLRAERRPARWSRARRRSRDSAGPRTAGWDKRSRDGAA